MALPLASILKALPTILNATSAIVGSLKTRRDTPGIGRTDDEIKKLEDDLLNTNKLLAELTRQVQSLAAAMREQAEAAGLRRKRLTAVAVTALACTGVSLAVLVVSLLSSN
ncbi:MAG: hypothetical protein ACREIA_08380 [Opitutaceae bacterium]